MGVTSTDGIYSGDWHAVGNARCFSAAAPARFPVGMLFWTENPRGDDVVIAVLLGPLTAFLERRHRHGRWVSVVFAHRMLRWPRVIERVEFPDAEAARAHARQVDVELAQGRLPGSSPRS